MTRTIVAASVLAVLLAAQVHAGEVPVQNLPGADFKPGALKLPLVVTERSGVERKGAVVTSGVPFPPGFLPDVKKLAVVDKDGKPVISQATLMVKWHKPVYDDSAQWVLVSFVADCPANSTATYYLTDDGKAPPPASPLKLTEEPRAWRVHTGPATFVIPAEGEPLLSSAFVNDKPVIGGAGLRSVITSGDWPDRGLKLADRHVGAHKADGVTIEESGPARLVVAIKGQYAPGDKEGKFYGFTTRLYFEANSPAVRIVHSINNTKLDSTLVEGFRRLYTWPIEDASLVADLAMGESVKVTTPAEEKQAVSDKALTVYQDSSGGEKWQNLGGGNYENWLSGYTKGQTVRGVSFRGYSVTGEGKELAAGNGHLGVLDVAGAASGVTAALRNFRVEYPSAIGGSAKSLRIGLFPGEFSEPFHLNNGQRKSWDVRLTLHGGKPGELKDAFAVQDALLLFRPEPGWMVRAASAGTWPYGLALVADPAKSPRKLRRDNTKLDGIQVGWDWHGWISSWNAGGGHWNQETVLAPWVLWGDGANFDHAEACALWSADLTPLNYENPDFPALWLWLMSWNDHEPRIKRERYPGWYNRDMWGLPDSGHMGMLMWPEYYFLTGDMRAREAMEGLGHRARAMLWRYNYDDRADGTGPMKGAVNWCRKQDPDAEPDFKLATRYVGWPLFDLANYYRLTGEPEILAECRTVARAFRNTARYSPIGFMVLEINAKGSRAVYGGQGPFEKYRDLSASQCYAHFQEGLMATGLVEYYLMSRDVEALDALIGFGDLMTHHCMLRDPQGNRRGWTYAFGDYWGPYTWEDVGGKGGTFLVSNFTVTEALGWITRFTGRADFAEVLQDAIASVPTGPAFGIAAAYQAVRHPKVDQTPPAAVSDLKAEPLGDGKVRLTWTAVGGDGKTGQAARYQVKYSTARVVERVTGWPDRAEPLPADKKEWEDRAAAFNAKQRAFWAAHNAADPPSPQQAGKTETMTLDNLPPGNYHFAIKAWDAADNMSGLSNVVQADVK